MTWEPEVHEIERRRAIAREMGGADRVQVHQEEDQEVVVLESMKMLTPVLATASGTVATVHVTIEDYVEAGAVLLTLE